jgi:hypothetical protein
MWDDETKGLLFEVVVGTPSRSRTYGGSGAAAVASG